MFLSNLSIKRPVFAAVMMLALVTLGIFSYRRLAIDLWPNVEIPYITIITIYPGASPGTVEREVSKRVEEAVNPISGVKHVGSISREGVSTVWVEFELEVDVAEAVQEARVKVSAIRDELPDEINEPVVEKIDFSSIPVVSLAVRSDRLSPRELTDLAEKTVQRRVENIDGVGKVNLVGTSFREVSVELLPERLEALGLGVDDVIGGIRAENVNLPVGRLTREGTERPLRVAGKPAEVDGYQTLVIAEIEGRPVALGDVARVVDGVEEQRTLALVDGKPAVALDVVKQSGANTVDVVDEVREEIAALQEDVPEGTTVEVVRDGSISIRESVRDVQETLIIGAFLTVLIVFLFLNSWRSTVITGLTLPIAVISSFIIMNIAGMTLNTMTLMALSLSIGLLIDDAIVVRENIVRHLERGEDHFKAAREGTSEIGLAVIATTMSIIAVFVPVAFMAGIVGRFFRDFGITVAFAVFVSLFVSFTLDPMLSSRWYDPDVARKGKRHPVARVLDRFNVWFDRTADRYRSVIAWSLDHRGRVAGIAAFVFLLTFPLNLLVGRDWIPADDQSELTISMNLPEGTSLSETSRVTGELADRIARLKEVAFVNPYVHEGITSHSHIYVRLRDLDQRKRSNLQVAAEVRTLCAQVPNLRYRVVIPSALGGGELWFPVRANVLGPDLAGTAELAKKVADRLRKVKGLLDVEPFVSLNSPELQVKIDRPRASDLGVRAADVAGAVRLMIAGEDQISTYKEEDEQYDVTLQLLPEQQKDPERLARLMIPSAKVGQVRLDNVATIERGLGPARIERFNRQFQVMVNANTSPEFPLDAAARAVSETFREVGLPPGYSYKFGGSVKILDETTHNLILAFLLASIFMYMVLAAQFDSFTHPFTIMLALPLSIPFALFSLWITGRTLNLWSALGVLLLLGIVKKNGILQVDYANKLREGGIPLREAILRANQVRLRPILMTTLSIVAGLIPTAVGLGAGSAQRSAVAVTIIGGQTLCLLLTLLVTPVAYSLLAEAGERGFAASLRPLLARVRPL